MRRRRLTLHQASQHRRPSPAPHPHQECALCVRDSIAAHRSEHALRRGRPREGTGVARQAARSACVVHLAGLLLGRFARRTVEPSRCQTGIPQSEAISPPPAQAAATAAGRSSRPAVGVRSSNRRTSIRRRPHRRSSGSAYSSVGNHYPGERRRSAARPAAADWILLSGLSGSAEDNL